MRAWHEQAVRFLLVHRKAVLLTTALVFALGIAGLFRLRMDSDLEHLLSKDDPTLQLTRQLQGELRTSRTLFLVLRAGSPADLEAALPPLVERLRGSAQLDRVTATRMEFAGPRYEWHRQAPLYALPEETLERLEARLAGPERPRELEAARRRVADDPLAGKEIVKRDPLGVRWIFDEAGDRMAHRFPARLKAGTPYLIFLDPAVAFLRMIGKVDSFNLDYTKDLLVDIRGRLRDLPPGVSFELIGGYVTAEHQAGKMRADMIFQTISSAVLVALFLHWYTRSLWIPFFLLVPLAVATVAGLALGGLVLGPMTPLVISVAAILIGQGIDFPVHFFARFRAERRDKDRDAAICEAQLSLGRPFLGAAGTTVAAFFALVASEFPGFRQFGMVLFIGFTACLIAALTVFPVLLMTVDRWVGGGAAAARDFMPRLVRWTHGLQSGRGRWIATAVIVAAGLASWGGLLAGKVKVDLDLRRSMPPGDPSLEGFARLERQLGVSLIPIFVLVDESDTLEEVRGKLTRLKAAGLIGASDGPQDYFASPAEQARADLFHRRTKGWVEGTLKDLGALGFRPDPFRKGLEELKELLEKPAPPPEALERPEFGPLKNAAYYSEGGVRRRVLTVFPRRSLWFPEDRRDFDAAARKELGAGARFFSAFHLPDHYARLLMADLSRVAGLTAAGVILIMLLVVGSLADGLRALVPVFLTTGFVFGLCALTGGAVNLMNVVAFPLIVGIGVDGGIHLICRYRQDGRRDPAGAILETGPGIWGSIATTLIGFGSIATSGVPGLASMGLLVGAGSVASLLSTLIVLPTLLPRRRD